MQSFFTISLLKVTFKMDIRYSMIWTFLVCSIFMTGCFSDIEETRAINSNADDPRTSSHLLDSAINRSNLSIPSFNNSNINLQYLSEDEWGMYFTLLRISHDGFITWIEQDSFTRLHSVFEYKLSPKEQEKITTLIDPIVGLKLKYPDPSRNLVDGGNNSLVFAKGDSVYIRYWQYNEMLSQYDLPVIESLIDSIKTVVQKRKAWYQN